MLRVVIFLTSIFDTQINYEIALQKFLNSPRAHHYNHLNLTRSQRKTGLFYDIKPSQEKMIEMQKKRISAFVAESNNRRIEKKTKKKNTAINNLPKKQPKP